MENEVQATEIQPLESWDTPVFTPVFEGKELVEKTLESDEKDVILDEKEDKNSEEVNVSESKTEEKADVFKVKVNGEEVDVSLEDLKKNFSGKVAYDKKFTELDKERKQFIKEKTQIEGYVNEFRNLANANNMVEATKFLGQLTGKAPHSVVEELITALQPEIERRYGLSQDQLNYEKQLAEVQFKAQQLESKNKQFESQQFEMELNTKIEDIMQSKSISVDDWDKAVLTLDTKLPKNQELTPELVAEYVVFERAVNKSSSLLSTFENGTLKDNKVVQESLRDIIFDNPDFTDEDLLTIINNSYSSSVKNKVGSLANKTTKQTKITQDTIKPLESWD